MATRPAVQPETTTLPSYASSTEGAAFDRLTALLNNTPIPDREILANLGLFIPRPSLSRTLFMHELYLKAMDVHGSMLEFGVRWGQNLALWSSFRNMYEPHNYNRRIVGFDTFEGFPNVSPKDGTASAASEGGYAVSPGYESYLTEILVLHEQLSPRGHLRRFELVKGDVAKTLPEYLEQHPELIVSLLYLDLDLYEPTQLALELLRDRMPKGAVIGFDELALAQFPGETVALKETLGLRNLRIRRSPISSHQSYIVLE